MYGLIGKSLKHSISPIIHNTFFKEINMKSRYDLFEVQPDKINDLLLDNKNNGYLGLNVTIPYKTEVIKYLSNISCEAEKIGAVNTIRLDNMSGYNTDYYGIHETFYKENVSIKGNNAVILGTGGAAKAAATYLLDKNIDKLILASRNPEKVNGFDSKIEILSYNNIENLSGIDILINCTPVGMYPNTDNMPISPEFLQGINFVFDMIYNPSETLLIKQARKKGIKAVNGLRMLVVQALKSQEIWNGIDVNEDVIQKVYEIVLLYMEESLNV